MTHPPEKHPRAIRWFHWVNFPLLFTMIWSGLLIYWANDVYRLGFGDQTLLEFFPNSFYEFFSLKHKLAEGMGYHFFFMWLFAINGVAYVLYTAFSGEWRYLVPNRKTFGEAFQVVLHDLGIRKEPPPEKKFNGAQQIAYTSVVLMGAGSLITGLAIYRPVQFGWITSLLGGYKAARAEHFILTIGYVLFFAVHIGQVIRAGWPNFREMLGGRDLKKSLGLGALIIVVGVFAWNWIRSSRLEDGLYSPLRKAHEFNEKWSRRIFKPSRTAPTYSSSDATRDLRVNGDIGLNSKIELKNWKLHLESGEKKFDLSLEEIKKRFPYVEMTTELKCVEGWSDIVSWGGVQLSEVLKGLGLVNEAMGETDSVSLETPDREYYVGIDLATALHSQTLLAFKMNGEDLTLEHGAPLRLVVPLKYGIKNIKRIGTIKIVKGRARDYWAEQGYDWYAGF